MTLPDELHDVERAYNTSKDVKYLASLALTRGQSGFAAELGMAYDSVERFARHLRDETAAKLKRQSTTEPAPYLDATAPTGSVGKITHSTKDT